MIKLDLSETPKELTLELRNKLTEEFKADKDKRVWDRAFLKKAVFAISNGKCSFSEIKLAEEGKYPEVEHFLPKSIYPEKVVEWGNLLPISSYCNKQKKDIDPNVTPLVNPLIDDPKDYFYILGGRLYPKGRSRKAVSTLEIFGLNEHLRGMRESIEEKTEKTLGDIKAFHIINPNRCVLRLKDLMREGGRKAEYSATVATYLLQSSIYIDLKLFLTSYNLWDDEFIDLEKELEFCSLPK